MKKFKMSGELFNQIATLLSQGKTEECFGILDNEHNYVHAVNLAMKLFDRKRAYDICLKYRDYDFLRFLEGQYYQSVIDELNIIK